MIASIEEIENFGIYEKYTKGTKLKDFERYNLFYGWNGSGKSTLSRLFRLLEIKSKESLPDGLKFNIKLDNCDVVTEKNLNTITEKVFVFNDDFIKKNIDWNGKIESILLLSEEKIEEIKEHNELKLALFGINENSEGLIGKQVNKKEKLQKQKQEIDKILSAIAKNIKSQLQVIATADTYYSNYNKTKVEKFIEGNRETLMSNKNILNDAEIMKFTNAASPVKKSIIDNSIKSIDLLKMKKLYEKVKNVLKTTISSVVIDELKDDSELSNWVESGLKIHKERDRKRCALCGCELTNKRIEELELYYNNAMQLLKSNIATLKQELENYKIDKILILKDTNIFYQEYADRISGLNNDISTCADSINIVISNIIDDLEKKNENPFEKINSVEINFEETINKYNAIVAEITDIVLEHNEKTNDFETITKEAKRKLELHYISEQLQALDYYERLDKEKKLVIDIEAVDKEIILKTKRYEELETELSNETLGAEEFNEKLEKFLGYSDIKLVFDSKQKGYKIIRNNMTEAKNLSEGEKTSIAFLYFITKLRENGNKIEDMIIVVDDPISSFDSNKIFHSYAFLKSECKEAEQVFILTHNYNYYSLVLGWLKKEKKVVGGKKLPAYALFRVETEISNGKRKSYIRNAGSGLTQSSEYDYVFYHVYKMKNQNLNKENSIYCGNISRKLVESFLSFKFPAQRGDLAALLDAAFPNKCDEVTKEKIYRFINVYSHHKFIDVYEQLDMDILDASSEGIINDILLMVKRLDENHYNAMIKKAEEEIQNDM